MSEMQLGLLLGFFIGGIVAIVGMCVLAAASNADREGSQ